MQFAMHELLGRHELAFETDVLKTRVIEMTKIFSGRKATLYAAGMAVSLFAMTGAAHAQSSTGAFKKGTWALTVEGKGGAKPGPTLTADQTAALAAEAAKKTAVTDTLINARSAATVSAQTAYAAALVTEKSAATAASTAAKTLATAEATKATADALVTKLATDKAAADAAITSATATRTVALAAQTALPITATAAEIAAAQAAVDRATVSLNLATAAQAPVATALTAAQGAATTALNAYTNAINGKAAADGALLNATATKTTTAATFNTALAADTGFASQLAAVNGAAGTTFAASYEGLLAIAAYDDTPAGATYGSNGFTRATSALAAAAASSNQNISLASGSLTGSAAALEVGANFETEVLSALVNHEDRITTAETKITAIDTRTTANTTAIAALDTRTTANTTAIANEVTARVAADNALGARITNETNERIAADNVLRDQIASSTATAIAMGGAALLPDMGFTLSGNIAIYEGAQAIALNAAAKIGPNAYVTAAVGGGLNKNGSVGGRVGFVFGF